MDTEKLRSRFSAARTAVSDFWKRRSSFITALPSPSLPMRSDLLKRIGEFSREACAQYIVRGEYTRRGLAILFVLAVLLGATIKSAVSDSITIGFEDYKLAPSETLIDLNAVQKQVLREGGSLSLSGAAAQGPSCSNK